MLLVSLVLMVGMFGVEGPSPFGRFLDFAFDHSEIARGFRTTYRAGTGLMLATAALLGIGVASAWAATAKRSPGGPPSPRPASRMLVRGLVVPVVVVGVVVASFPFWTGRLYPEGFTFESIPRYWDRAFDYLAAQEQPSRVLVLPGAEQARHRWGHVQDTLFDGLSPAAPLINRVLPQGTAESADLVAAIDEYVASTGYVRGTLAPILAAARRAVGGAPERSRLAADGRPPPGHLLPPPRRSGAAPRRHVRPSGPEHRRRPRRRRCPILGERSLPPVEIYEVAGKPSPQPRLAAGPPLLVSGAGDSWPSLAAAGLLRRAAGRLYRRRRGRPMRSRSGSTSGAEVVVTDGNRRRAIQATSGRPRLSPTLAFGEPHGRGCPPISSATPQTQSLATYADAATITASRYGDALRPYEVAARPASAFDRVERTAWMLRGASDPTGESLTVELRDPVAVSAVSVLPRAEGSARVQGHRRDRRAPRTVRRRVSDCASRERPTSASRARINVADVSRSSSASRG